MSRTKIKDWYTKLPLNLLVALESIQPPHHQAQPSSCQNRKKSSSSQGQLFGCYKP